MHTDHGIARYLGLETIAIDQRNRDCLLLQYAEKDRLYVPIEEFNRVSKYSGKDGAPALTRLGGPTWDKLKKKTRKAVEDMAADLIKLYAERRTQEGFSQWLHNTGSCWSFSTSSVKRWACVGKALAYGSFQIHLTSSLGEAMDGTLWLTWQARIQASQPDFSRHRRTSTIMPHLL